VTLSTFLIVRRVGDQKAEAIVTHEATQGMKQYDTSRLIIPLPLPFVLPNKSDTNYSGKEYELDPGARSLGVDELLA
jgi:hypothetical protein